MSLLGIAGKNIIFAIPNKEIQCIFFLIVLVSLQKLKSYLATQQLFFPII